MTEIALHPDLDKALRDMFVRMKKQERTISQDVTREIIRPVMTGGGTGIAPTAVPDMSLGGDLSGTLSAAEVEKIQGIIITGTPTALDDILVITSLSPLTATWMANPFPTGHEIQDEGVALAERSGLDFVGTGVTVTDDSLNDKTIVTIPGASGADGHVIQEEGSPLTARVALDFVGNGVTVTDDPTNNKTVVTIPGLGSISLDNLSDVVITTPDIGDVLVFNGTSWVNQEAAEIEVTSYIPVTNGDPDFPEILFDADGDVVYASIP